MLNNILLRKTRPHLHVEGFRAPLLNLRADRCALGLLTTANDDTSCALLCADNRDSLPAALRASGDDNDLHSGHLSRIVQHGKGASMHVLAGQPLGAPLQHGNRHGIRILGRIYAIGSRHLR